MTREQAKGNLIHAIRWNDMPKKEALDIAIKALEQEPKTWSLDDIREDFMYDVYNTLHFLPTNDEANQIIESFDRVTSSIKQQPCEVEAAKLQQAYNKGFEDCRQAVLNTISELNAISFYEAQEDSKKCYYEIRQAVKNMPPVTQQSKTVLYSGDGYADGYMVYDMAECPNCGYEYEDGDKDLGLSFCPNCGQALNWKSEVRNEDR